MVFIQALGYYITPALVGGADDQMISYFIAFYASKTVNWGMAAALGFTPMIGSELEFFLVKETYEEAREKREHLLRPGGPDDLAAHGLSVTVADARFANADAQGTFAGTWYFAPGSKSSSVRALGGAMLAWEGETLIEPPARRSGPAPLIVKSTPAWARW